MDIDLGKLMGYPAKWFILMHESLYDDNPNLIGFRDYDEWYPIESGELVVYYQFGRMRLRGIFEVGEIGKPLDSKYGTRNGRNDFSLGELRYQCRINPIHLCDFPFTSEDASKLRFYKRLRNPARWDGKRAFEIRNPDLGVIFSLLK